MTIKEAFVNKTFFTLSERIKSVIQQTNLLLSKTERTGAPGWLSQLSILLLISAHVMHDLMVYEFEPHVELCTDSAEPTWDCLSLLLSLPLLHSLSLSQNK